METDQPMFGKKDCKDCFIGVQCMGVWWHPRDQRQDSRSQIYPGTSTRDKQHVKSLRLPTRECYHYLTVKQGIKSTCMVLSKISVPRTRGKTWKKTYILHCFGEFANGRKRHHIEKNGRLNPITEFIRKSTSSAYCYIEKIAKIAGKVLN